MPVSLTFSTLMLSPGFSTSCWYLGTQFRVDAEKQKLSVSSAVPSQHTFAFILVVFRMSAKMKALRASSFVRCRFDSDGLGVLRSRIQDPLVFLEAFHSSFPLYIDEAVGRNEFINEAYSTKG